jgi:hypothetical protein
MRLNTTTRLGTGSRSEPSLFLAVYIVYNLARWLFVGDLDAARQHARSIVELEQSAGLAIERPVQDALDSPATTRLLSYSYLAAQFVVLPGALIWQERRAAGQSDSRLSADGVDEVHFRQARRGDARHGPRPRRSRRPHASVAATPLPRP